MASFSSSLSFPLIDTRDYDMKYYRSEETFNRLPGKIIEGGLIDKINTLEIENAELRLTVANLRVENCNLRRRLLKEVEKREKQEYSRDSIADFSCTEVQSMLEDIGLGDYITVFARELIDGSILVTLDEQVLKDELLMKSSSDRQILLKLINGEETVKASSEKKLV